MQPKPCLSPRKRPAGTDPTQQLQRWGLVAKREGPGLKAPKPTALHHPSLGCLGGLRGLPEFPVSAPNRAPAQPRQWGDRRVPPQLTAGGACQAVLCLGLPMALG